MVEAVIGERERIAANTKQDIEKEFEKPLCGFFAFGLNLTLTLTQKTGNALMLSCFLLAASLKLQPTANRLLGAAILPKYTSNSIKIHRGYYTEARRYEFYLRVVTTIFDQ